MLLCSFGLACWALPEGAQVFKICGKIFLQFSLLVSLEKIPLAMYPFGRFSEPLTRHLQRIGDAISLQFPFQFYIKKRPFRLISRTADFGCLVAIPFRG